VNKLLLHRSPHLELGLVLLGLPPLRFL
jgi:hypothetical protein